MFHLLIALWNFIGFQSFLQMLHERTKFEFLFLLLNVEQLQRIT